MKSEFAIEKGCEVLNRSAEVVYRSCQRLSRSRSKFRRRTKIQWCSGRSPPEPNLLQAANGYRRVSISTCDLKYFSFLARPGAAGSLRFRTLQLAALLVVRSRQRLPYTACLALPLTQAIKPPSEVPAAPRFWPAKRPALGGVRICADLITRLLSNTDVVHMNMTEYLMLNDI